MVAGAEVIESQKNASVQSEKAFVEPFCDESGICCGDASEASPCIMNSCCGCQIPRRAEPTSGSAAQRARAREKIGTLKTKVTNHRTNVGPEREECRHTRSKPTAMNLEYVSLAQTSALLGAVTHGARTQSFSEIHISFFQIF